MYQSFLYLVLPLLIGGSILLGPPVFYLGDVLSSILLESTHQSHLLEVIRAEDQTYRLAQTEYLRLSFKDLADILREEGLASRLPQARPLPVYQADTEASIATAYTVTLS
jgi:hypothetical protein